MESATLRTEEPGSLSAPPAFYAALTAAALVTTKDNINKNNLL